MSKLASATSKCRRSTFRWPTLVCNGGKIKHECRCMKCSMSRFDRQVASCLRAVCERSACDHILLRGPTSLQQHQLFFTKVDPIVIRSLTSVAHATDDRLEQSRGPGMFDVALSMSRKRADSDLSQGFIVRETRKGRALIYCLCLSCLPQKSRGCIP